MVLKIQNVLMSYPNINIAGKSSNMYINYFCTKNPQIWTSNVCELLVHGGITRKVWS
jgi:hypothetical protein